MPVHRGPGMSKLAAILDVVVHQKRVVEHFDCRRRIQGVFVRPPKARQVARHKAGRSPLPELSRHPDTRSYRYRRGSLEGRRCCRVWRVRSR